MMEYFIKLNKYQKGIVISLLILSLSLIGFMFNSRVRLGEPQDEIPDIIIEDPIDIEPKDKVTYEITKESLFMLIIYAPLVYALYKMTWRFLDD